MGSICPGLLPLKDMIKNYPHKKSDPLYRTGKRIATLKITFNHDLLQEIVDDKPEKHKENN